MKIMKLTIKEALNAEKSKKNKSVNDRPASLKSVICNVLESIIGDHYGGLYQ